MQRPSSCETLPSARNKRDNARKTGSDVLIVKQQVCKYSVLVETEQSKTCQTTWIRLPSLLLGNGPTSGDYFEENYRGWTLQAAGTASGLSLWSKGVDGRNLLKSQNSWFVIYIVTWGAELGGEQEGCMEGEKQQSSVNSIRCCWRQLPYLELCLYGWCQGFFLSG